MSIKQDAIRNLYLSVVTIRGDEAEDANGEPVAYDEAAVQAEVQRLQAEYDSQEYARLRKAEYPPMEDYLDGVVKGDQAQIDKYIADCLAVKSKYPK